MGYWLMLWAAMLIGTILLVTCCVVVLPTMHEADASEKRHQP